MDEKLVDEIAQNQDCGEESSNEIVQKNNGDEEPLDVDQQKFNISHEIEC